MENASKALIMAGGVLIAILLLTLFSYLFTKISSSTASVYDNLEKHEIDEFNQQFLKYEGKTDLTVQDVATLINLVQDSKKNSSISAEVTIKIGTENVSSKKAMEWLDSNKTSDKTYTCTTVTTNQNTLLVNFVQLTVNS